MRFKRAHGWAAAALVVGACGAAWAQVGSICSILCVAPPAGCHYEGALTSGPCDRVTCGTLVCDSETDLLVFHIDNPGGENSGHLRVGRGLGTGGDVRSWASPSPIPGWFGSEDQGGGLASGDVNRNGRPDILAFHIDNPSGENRGYYRVGWDLEPGGGPRSWTSVKAIPGWFGSEDQGGGVALGNINRNALPDLVVFHIDNPAGENRGYYRIGWDLSRSGGAARWTEPRAIPGWFGSEDQGGGIALGDIDRNGRPELVAFHIDNPVGENRGYYRIGWNLDEAGVATRWSDPEAIPGWFGSEDQGGDIALADVNRDGLLDLIAFHIDNPAGENHGYYRVGYGLDHSGRVTGGWIDPKLIPGWFGSRNQGGGIAVVQRVAP